MTALEINNIRLQGDLDAAYEAVCQAMETEPEDIVLKRVLGWTLCDRLKQAVDQSGSQEKVLQELQRFSEAQIRPEETALYVGIVWNIRTAIANYTQGPQEQYAFLERLTDLFVCLNLPDSDKMRTALSALSGLVMRNHQAWAGQGRLLYHCGLTRLSEADYRPFEGKSGQIMANAEKMDIRICKYFLGKSKEDILSFLPEQKAFTEAHPDYTYPPYYLTKLLLAVGDADAAIEVLRPFALHKAKDFWVWQLLGDAHTEPQSRLAFYCKALLCSGPEKMKVGLYEDFASLLAGLEDVAHARWLLQQDVRIRQENGWHPTSSLSDLLRSSWAQGEVIPCERTWLEEQAGSAEEFLFGKMTDYPVLVTFVNPDKRMISFVTEDRRQSFFRWGNGSLPKVGDVLNIHCKEIAAEGPTQVKRHTLLHDRTNPKFFRHFAGSLHLISGGNAIANQTFIPSSIVGGRTEGMEVSGLAMIDFNKKRGEWGFRAIELEQ